MQHRSTQDFTVEGIHREGSAIFQKGPSQKSPIGVQGQSPGRGSRERSPTEAEAKCEISIQFLTISGTKFRSDL